MKRHWMISGVVAVVLVAGMILAGTALAQGPQGDKDGVRVPIGGAYGPANGFVDADGDGVNDRYLTGDCDGTGTGTANAYPNAQGGQGQMNRSGDMLQNRMQQQVCDGDCAQDGTCDQLQTRSRDSSAAGQGGASAGTSTGSSPRGQRGR